MDVQGVVILISSIPSTSSGDSSIVSYATLPAVGMGFLVS